MTLPTVFPPITLGQYAIAFALVTLHDGGIADLVDLHFDQGFWRRAHIAPELLRLGPQLSGRWQATFFFRTAHDGRLKEHPYVTVLRPVREDDRTFYWEAIGRHTQSDSATGLVSFRVSPETPGVKPFLLRATTSRVQPATLDKGTLYGFKGGLVGECLAVEHAVAVEVVK
ncbi:hypothetical protein [Deinococcus sp. UYEF24]